MDLERLNLFPLREGLAIFTLLSYIPHVYLELNEIHCEGLLGMPGGVSFQKEL